MSEVIKKKYGENSVGEFWIFIEKLNYKSCTADAESVKRGLLKSIAPHQSEKYHTIADIYARELAATIVSPDSTAFVGLLPAAFLAVEKGKEVYNICLSKRTLPVNGAEIEQLSVTNHLGNVFPSEDDYFNQVIPDPIDDDLDY